MTEHVEYDRRLDGQKIAVAWIVYAFTLGLLFLVSVCGFPGGETTVDAAPAHAAPVHASAMNAPAVNAAAAMAAAH